MSEATRDGTWVLAELKPDVAQFDDVPAMIVVRWDEGAEWWFEPHYAFGHPEDDFLGWRPLPSGDGDDFAIYIIEEDEHDVHVSFADGFRARVATDSDIGMALLRIDAITRQAQKPPCSAPVDDMSGRGTAEGDPAGRASEPTSGDGA